MNNYNNDPIIEELHRIREELAARFNFDIYAIGADLKAQQAKEIRPVISLATKRIITQPDDLEIQDRAA